ncbi:outer membrane receptor protein involved in Fe transport [Novosphingobium sp. SG751A]|uniref:TonB-dependent receptor n=1 Tax=Novosphingobium sp. SG751A TaxID=2587000 RepID=UPI0015553E62|nr:TonB-dependent receptor [Novosphingobium sp. SG751A]NOW44993.1 outer membrane receptor protein involved in Fe transport [Novosphingobium sp. SG751A]
MLKKTLFCGCALFALCAELQPASAQVAPQAQDPKAGEATSSTSTQDQNGDEIIVTGSARQQRRFDVSYAANALSQNDITKLAPASMADLLGKLPGIQVESTGGEVQNITRIRGIPTDDGLAIFQQDGLPLFHDVNGNFFRGDSLNRYDLMTDRVEVVRGGPAPIVASQAAAVINNVTVSGSQTPRGKAQLTYGTTDLYRLDLMQSGPLGANTYYAIGGFLRKNGGYRDNGFPNDRGGQIRANIKHDFDNGSIKFTANYLNDHNVFYLPVPVADPRQPTRSLDPWLAFFTGTANTPALRNAQIKYRDSTGVVQSLARDLADGRHTEFWNVGLQYEGDFDDWHVSAKGGYTSGKLRFDALYSTSNPVDGAANATLTAARAAQFPTATRLGYAIAGTNGTQVYDPNSDSGLVMQSQYRYVASNFSSAQGDLSVTRKFDTGLGSHDLKIGAYGSFYSESNFQAYQNYLMQVKGQPQLLDLVAYNAAGNVVGYVTDKGVLQYTTTLNKGNSDNSVLALYANDTWELTRGLRIDGGIRYERYHLNGYALTSQAYNLGDTATLADDAVQGFNGGQQNRTINTGITNWTVGANYDFTSHFGGYVRASHLEVPPSGTIGYAINPVVITTKANQYEVGLKAAFGRSYLYVTGFYTKFNPLNSSFVPFDPATGAAQATVPFISQVIVKGIEADGALNIVPWFSLGGSLTVQDPYYSNLQSTVAGLSAAQVEGNQVIREPKVFGNIRPSFNFSSGDAKFELYGRFEYTGRRFVDFTSFTELPAYHSYSAGVTATYKSWQFQVVGDNLTNARGLTEGNTRTDTLSGQGTRIATFGRPVFGRNFRFVLSKSW